MVKDLIIVRAGKNSLHRCWLDEKVPRSWDLLLCPYEEIPPPPIGITASDVIPGHKFAGLRILLNEWQGWRDYRYVMLADDDLFATQQTWSQFFDRCAYFGAKHAQPALHEGSFFCHSITVRNSEFVARRVSFVEVMTPCFHADVFPEIIATLDLTVNGLGLGLDFLWSKKLGYKDVFVIDQTPVLHTRPVTNRAPDKELMAEMNKIMRDNHAPWLMKTFCGILPNGEEIAEGHPAFLYRLFRGYERIFAQDPRHFDNMIQLQLAAVPAGGAA
jgi:hypothetical protein